MPTPLTISDLSNAVWSGVDTGEWNIEIYAVTGNTLLGTYQNEDTYVDGNDGEYTGIYLKFIEVNECMWLEYTDTLTLSHDGDNIVIRFPASAGISHNDVLYVDSSGLLYSDAALTTPAVDWVDIIPEETITPSDTIGLATEFISDSISITETLLMTTESISDTVFILDELTQALIELTDEVNMSDDYTNLTTWWDEQKRGNNGSWTERKGGVS